jgi:hypothetical protein
MGARTGTPVPAIVMNDHPGLWRQGRRRLPLYSRADGHDALKVLPVGPLPVRLSFLCRYRSRRRDDRMTRRGLARDFVSDRGVKPRFAPRSRD